MMLKAALRPYARLCRDDLFPPKLGRTPKVPTEIRVWDADQVGRFLSQIQSCRHFLLFWFAIETGMRQGEIIALTWQHVAGNFINVVRGYNRKTKKVDDLKTPSSRRRIKIDDDLASALEARRGKATDPVFPALDGTTMLNPRNLVRAFHAAQAAVRKAEKEAEVEELLPRLRFHDLRHTMATLMLGNRADITAVSERLGHASRVMTLDVYSHVLPTKQDEAAVIIGNLIRNKVQTKVQTAPDLPLAS
jgi:integrase